MTLTIILSALALASLTLAGLAIQAANAADAKADAKQAMLEARINKLSPKKEDL